MRIFANRLRNATEVSELTVGVTGIDAFENPVAYLAQLGIDAELVEVDLNLPEAA
jgi:hypothetical protein